MPEKLMYELQNVNVEFALGSEHFKALNEISLQGYFSETLGVVGESGSGKSTLAKTLLGLQPPSHGTVSFEGQNIFSLAPKELRYVRRSIQMIFQDPDASLNPRMTVQEHIKEAIKTTQVSYSGSLAAYIQSLLDMVQLPSSVLPRYSYQLSGGQKQRVSIARALSVKPKLLVCDEPLSSLDISVVAQILLLLKSLQDTQKLSYLFITHDLASLRYIAHRVIVLYLGKIMELAPANALYTEPLHPYTQALMAAIPSPIPKKEKSPSKLCVIGDLPSVINPPKGCVFHTRCPFAMDICRQVTPPLQEIKHGQKVACHLYSNKQS